MSQLRIIRLFESVAFTKSAEGKFFMLVVAFSTGDSDSDGELQIM